MRPLFFALRYGVSREKWKFIRRFKRMSEAWDACDEPTWLSSWLRAVCPDDREVFSRLAIVSARYVIQEVSLKDIRPARAVDTAEKWLENPSDENERFAREALRDCFAGIRTCAGDPTTSCTALTAASYASLAVLHPDKHQMGSADNALSLACTERYARIELCDLIRGSIPNPFMKSWKVPLTRV